MPSSTRPRRQTCRHDLALSSRHSDDEVLPGVSLPLPHLAASQTRLPRLVASQTHLSLELPPLRALRLKALHLQWARRGLSLQLQF